MIDSVSVHDMVHSFLRRYNCRNYNLSCLTSNRGRAQTEHNGTYPWARELMINDA